MPEVEIAICGAGPVGAACALFLHERGVAATRIALVDARSREAAAGDDRMIAISEGSATLLARLGAWHDRVDARATPIATIHISQRGRFGRTVIDRRDYRVAALGHVIRLGDLTEALDAVLESRGIRVRRPARVTAVDVAGDRLTLALATPDDSAIVARHVVHAEGGLFDQQRRRPIHRDYGQTAVTAFVTLEQAASGDLAHTAFERFTEDGPIALLPARRAGGDGYALVWCGRPEDAAVRLAWSDPDFLDGLHAAFGDRLGRFASVDGRRAYPLGLNALDVTARARSDGSAEFAIGNAAQTLHPVAGQGLNLGLRDAYQLARLLADDTTHDAASLARRFESARRGDRRTVVGLTDFMPRVFASPLWPLAWGRGLALALLDIAPPLRGVFARQMMDGRR